MNSFLFYYKELCHNNLGQNILIKREEKLNDCGKKVEQTLFGHYR